MSNTGKGFTRNFLKLMNSVENECCSGSGGNLFEIAIEDTASLNLSGNGKTISPLKGDVKISQLPGNIISIFDDGIYAQAPGGTPLILTAANGLSAFGSEIVLGNDLNGSPDAILTSNREIPTNNFTIALSGTGKLLIGTTNADLTASQLQSTTSISLCSSDSIFVNSKNATNGLRVFSSNSFNRQITIAGVQTFVGHMSGSANNVGVSNVGIGYRSLTSILSNAQNNTAVGTNSLRQTTTGFGNTAIGLNAGLNNTTGNLNVIIGNDSALNITTDSNNTLVGSQCFVSSGLDGNGNGVTGSNNTVVGCNGGGSNLSFFGTSTTINNSILIGTYTGVTSEGQSINNVVIIGNGIRTPLSNILILGRTDQNTIIGETSPTTDNGAKLQVKGEITTSSTISGGSGKWRLGQYSNVSIIGTGRIMVTVDGVDYWISAEPV